MLNATIHNFRLCHCGAKNLQTRLPKTWVPDQSEHTVKENRNITVQDRREGQKEARNEPMIWDVLSMSCGHELVLQLKLVCGHREAGVPCSTTQTYSMEMGTQEKHSPSPPHEGNEDSELGVSKNRSDERGLFHVASSRPHMSVHQVFIHI